MYYRLDGEAVLIQSLPDNIENQIEQGMQYSTVLAHRIIP